MLTEGKLGKPRQSWLRRLWPFSAVRADRTENPRVTGSIPVQATSSQRLTSAQAGRLGSHFEHVLIATLLSLCCAVAGAGEFEGPPEPRGRLRAAAIDAAWIGGAAGLDLWSTDHALGRCRTCYEGTPWMRGSLPARAGVKLAMTGVGVAWADHLRRKGDRQGARLVRWGLVGLQIGFAAWNLSRAR